MRRFDSDRPSPSVKTAIASRTASIIVKWLAHAHEHDIGHRADTLARRHEPSSRRLAAREITQPIAGDENLSDDFRRCQIANERHCAGMAERAVQCAAHLARDAESATIRLRDIHALDLGPVVAGMRRRHPHQPFARAVGRNLLGEDVGTRQVAALGKPVEQRPSDVAHRRELMHAAMIDPVPELGEPHVPLALGDAEGGEGGQNLGTRRPREAPWRAALCMRNAGHAGGFYHVARAAANDLLSHGRGLRGWHAKVRPRLMDSAIPNRYR